VILIATSFLLVDARNHERTYELLNEVGAFPRLVELISSPKQHGNEGVHRLLMELIYEMSRIQRISPTDLGTLDRVRWTIRRPSSLSWKLTWSWSCSQHPGRFCVHVVRHDRAGLGRRQ